MDSHNTGLNNTTNLVGLRNATGGQSKNEGVNTRSSSVARLHPNTQGTGAQMTQS